MLVNYKTLDFLAAKSSFKFLCNLINESRQPAQVEWRYDEDGNRVRVSVRSGRIIPIPKKALDQTEDMVDRNDYLGKLNISNVKLY